MWPDMRNLVYVIVSAAAAAASLISGEIVIRVYDLSPLPMVITSNALGGTLLLAVTGFNGEIYPRSLKGRDWLRLLISAMFIFGLGNSFIYTAVRLIGSGRTALLTQLEV